MKTKVIPLDYTYLAQEIDEIADKLSAIRIVNRSFLTFISDFADNLSQKEAEDCYEHHIEDIKSQIKQVYEHKVLFGFFQNLITMSLSEYIKEKLIEHIDIIAYNYLVNYVNANNLNTRVSYEMIETIAHNANEYTSPQELIDNLHSFLED